LKKYTTAEEAVKIIKSYDKVFVHGSAATPEVLLAALEKRADELKQVNIISLSTYGNMPIAQLKYKNSFYFNDFQSVLCLLFTTNSMCIYLVNVHISM
jgi:acyl-CoA hydrolase